MEQNSLELSLVIPLYNEEPILEESLKEIKLLLDTFKFLYEVILIDDKSRDKTVEIAKKFTNQNKDFKLFCHDKNQGRGGTVRDGIKMAKGSMVGFIDIDLEVPVYNIIPCILKIEEGFDVATIHRIYKLKLNYRWIMSKGYGWLVKLICKTPLKDTETGCKFFNREKILPVLDKTVDNHWFWYTEIMVISYYENLKIIEIPALFIKKSESLSSVNYFSDSVKYFLKLIKFRKVVKRYNNSKSKAQE